VLPSFDGVLSGRGEAAVDAERIAAQQQKRGRIVRFDRGDDSSSGLRWIAGLGAVRRVIFLTAFAGGVGVVINNGAGLGQGATGKVGAKRAGLNDSD
jgi:hypothetical protein